MRGYNLNNFRILWLGLYIVAAIVAASIFAATGMLGGDSVDIPLPNFRTLIVASSSVVISYLVWMGPVFRVMEKRIVAPWDARWREEGLPDDDRKISIFVLVLQLSFLAYCIVEGVGIAGSVKHVDIAIKYIWIALPADAIFLVYYAMYRQSYWFIPNLFTYILSNLLRGWLGFWLIILFLEVAFRLREKKIHWRGVGAALTLFFFFVPYLIEIKWAIRKFGNAYIFNLGNLYEIIKGVNWWESIVRASEAVLLRLQHLDIVIVIVDHAAMLSEKLHNREFLYFFEEGLPQFTLERLLGWPRVPDIHIKLIDYFAVHPAGGTTISNTHNGLVGWLWIAPEWIVAYLGYVLILTWAGVWLVKKLGDTEGLAGLVWFAVLVWVMNGWFGAYIEFLQALAVVLIAKMLANKWNNRSQNN